MPHLTANVLPARDPRFPTLGQPQGMLPGQTLEPELSQLGVGAERQAGRQVQRLAQNPALAGGGQFSEFAVGPERQAARLAANQPVAQAVAEPVVDPFAGAVPTG